MNKYFKKAMLLTILSLILSGCGVDKVKDVDADENENTKVQVSQDEVKMNVAEDFEKILASGAELEEIKAFIDEHIEKADRETGDKMVYKLIELQKETLGDEIDYFYNEGSLKIQQEIQKTYEKAQSKFDKSATFVGKNKTILMDNMEDEEIAKDLKRVFDKGYGLFCGEGTYYPVIDYSIMKENYSENVTDQTAAYLDIMGNEIDEPTLVEEYLAIEVDELKDRTLQYEEFLKKYPDAPYIEDVRIMYMGCIWKIVNPNIFDGMLDEQFKIIKELDQVYSAILKDDSHAVTYEAVKGITEFIKSKKGVLGTMDNMDDLYDVSYKLHDEVDKQVRARYLGDK